MRRQVAALGTMMTVIALTVGCASTPNSVVELERPQVATDEVDEASLNGAGIDPASTRFAGESDGWRVFLGRTLESELRGSEICALLFSARSESFVACSSELPLVTSAVEESIVVLVSVEPAEVPTGFNAISDSVYVR